jgi:AcrR family transcriptional regulator
MVARRARADETKSRPRPQLAPATIIDAALRLSVGGSPDQLTVRGLGKELGADPTAIYRHFRDKDELVRAVLDKLISDSVAAVDHEAPWRERLTQLADVSLETLISHPSIGALAGSQSTGGRGELAAIETIIVAMNEAGLDHEDSVRFYAVLSSYVISFSSAQAASLLTGEREADDAWIGVTSSLHHARHPAIAAVRDELEALRDRDIYESGVQVILDAVEARAASSGQS